MTIFLNIMHNCFAMYPITVYCSVILRKQQ